MGQLPPKDTVRYQKESYPPRLTTLEEHNKDSPWVDTWKISILGQGESLEAGEDLLTPTKSPYQISTNSEEVDKYAVGDKLTREEMAKLWSTEKLLGWEDMEFLVWHHRMKNCSFK